MGVQFAYLFGGLDTLARTGLTYSEYARRGFFELVAVAALVIALVLAVDWLVKPTADRRLRWVNGLHALLLALTTVILLSALYRMRLYVDEFGLTELRFYTSVFMAWIGFALLWTAGTVLRDRRHRFVVGTLVAGLVLLVGVNLANPDAVIARYNLQRTGETERPLDVNYVVAELSADAVPTLIALLETLDPDEQRQLATALTDKRAHLQYEREGRSWRGLDWGTVRAQRVLDALLAEQ